MYIKDLLIMVVFLQTAVSVPKIGLVNEIVCEHEEMNLECPQGYVIHVLSALFGKRNYKYCYQPGHQDENCAAEKTLDIVKRKCNLRQRCRLSAVGNVFGDPCNCTFKYLEVAYKCLKNNDIISILVCEQDTVTMTCPEGKRIKLVNALYGRKIGHTCTAEHTSLKCDSITALEILSHKCDFSKDCTVTASDKLFGDPCIPLTSKYLELDYMCITIPTRELMSNNSCEIEDTMILSCEKGYINMISAFFGKRNNRICVNPSDANTTSHCEAFGTLDIMKYKCDFKRDCSVNVSIDVFGDPCPGVTKYLEVDYYCTHAKWDTAVACEHDNLKISCYRGKFLWIVDAVFGRRDQELCYKPDKTIVNNTCNANNALDIVESRCQNNNKCSVVANVQTFGDPCCYSYKYLEVNYVCRDKKRLCKYFNNKTH